MLESANELKLGIINLFWIKVVHLKVEPFIIWIMEVPIYLLNPTWLSDTEVGTYNLVTTMYQLCMSRHLLFGDNYVSTYLNEVYIFIFYFIFLIGNYI